MQHLPVMPTEVLAALAVDPEGFYLDGTLGGGGHARLILDQLGPKGRLVGIDKDRDAITRLEKKLGADSRVELWQGSFSQLGGLLKQSGWLGQVNGIFLDLGVSSMQLQTAVRGFAFQLDGPLDMRMDVSQGRTAAEWLATVSEPELIWVLKEFGEERFAPKVARAIIRQRERAPLLSTGQLAEIVASAVPRAAHGKRHPATRTFQAIRIQINRELEDLRQFLLQAPEILARGGRLVVLSFHSLEDRLVKTYLRHYGGVLKDEFGNHLVDPPLFRVIRTSKKPRAQEVSDNPRARSAILRVAERTSVPATAVNPNWGVAAYQAVKPGRRRRHHASSFMPLPGFSYRGLAAC